MKEEAAEALDGDAGTQRLFQSIYAGACSGQRGDLASTFRIPIIASLLPQWHTGLCPRLAVGGIYFLLSV